MAQLYDINSCTVNRLISLFKVIFKKIESSGCSQMNLTVSTKNSISGGINKRMAM